MKLDESMRDRLAKLAESENSSLSDSARARVLRVALAKRMRPARLALSWWGAPILVAACALVLLSPALSTHVQQPAPIPASQARLRTPMGGPLPDTQAALPTAPCIPLDTQPWLVQADGSRLLDLGDYARVATEAASKLGALSASSCGILLTLADGPLSVHARALRGAPLVVRTQLADVEVHGTVFRVDSRKAGNQVSVSVAEGTVWVTLLASRELFVLKAGQRITLQGRGKTVQRGKLEPRSRGAIEEKLGIRQTAAPPLTIDASVRDGGVPALAVPSEGERGEARIWRQGALLMPELAPQPGSSMTEDGHPMSKPHLIQGAKP